MKKVSILLISILGNLTVFSHGIGTPSPVNTPLITVSLSDIYNFYSIGSTPSAAQSYIVQGTDLTSDLVVSTGAFPSFNFEVSLTETPFVAGQIHLTPVAGTVAPTTIYVRMRSAYDGAVYDAIENSSTGAQIKYVAAYGNVLSPEPTVQSTISFGASTNNSIVVNLNGGNGVCRLLVAKESVPVDFVPQDGSVYSYAIPLGIFGVAATQVGTGNYVVYNGQAQSIVVSGLTAGKTYHFTVYEYNRAFYSAPPNPEAYGSQNYLLPGSSGNGATPFSPLPITINYFKGFKQNGKHLLNWKVTCTNTPRATMTLERSADARNFSGINTITADAVRCSQPFDHTDTDPLTGMNYYRLKMADADGKISYSGIVALLNAAKGFEIMDIAPNPVTGSSFKLGIAAAKATNMDIVITDMMGRVVNRQTVSLIEGYNSIDMNITGLARGTYNIYGAIADDRSKLLRLVKE